MSFFDDSHVTDVGLQGSLGSSVSFTEMVGQSYKQQFRVDSARALDDELRNRWLDSLRSAQIAHAETVDPADPWAYRAFAQHVKGEPIDTFDPNKKLFDYDPTERIKGMAAANEAIKKLGNPDIKTFEQILEEVAQMQQETEAETASMYERSGSGGFVASLLGAIGGSFTARDPLNIITAPIGAGRTVATRIASEMGIAAGVVGYTELAEVAPARQIVGLPERSAAFNIAAATLGAGVIRGGLEAVGYGLKRFNGADPEGIDFDLRDSQLAQMFEANDARPSARAGAQILDDTVFLERNNPYGDGRAAEVRFIAELQSVQRAMNGEPVTAVARALPPMPYEAIKKAADFEIVREQAPELYAKMEAAQAKVAGLRGGNMSFERVSTSDLNEDANIVKFTYGKVEGELIWRNGETEADINIYGKRASTSSISELRAGLADIKDVFPELKAVRVVRISGNRGDAPEVMKVSLGRPTVERRTANAEYQAAYRAVEAESVRIREQQARVEATQQREASTILAAEGRPFVGPLLRHDNVESLVDRINTFNDTLDEATAARFVKQAESGESEAPVRETWRTEDGRIDIGLREPVDPDFRVPTEDGDITVAAAMRDLQDDTDLVEAIKGCAI